jgi:hypothetical protein
MEPATPDLLARTVQSRYPNRERKLARNVFMQATWALLALTAVTQLFLLVWLDLL